MGLLSCIVAADESACVELGESLRPLDEWSGIEAPGLDGEKMALLHCLLTGDEYAIALTLQEPVYVSDSGVCVLRVADSVVEKLAAHEDDTLADLAVELAAAADFEIDGWAVEDVHALLVEFGELARLAESQAQTLFVWICPRQ